MPDITVKGHTFPDVRARDSFYRRAVKYQNNIVFWLRKLGLTEDDVEIELERMAMRDAPASVTWFLDGYQLYYSYSLQGKYVDNLYIISKVIECEVAAVLNDEKSLDDFLNEFAEEDDVEAQRIEARKTLGLDPDEKDMDVINKKFKELSKKFHPDMPGGDVDKFKEVNTAHKIIKRELV